MRNGLLPAALVFSATTRQADFDIDVTIGFYPGINSSAARVVNGAGLPSALQTPGIDARQVFFTFGDASWGTVKMGRDIGLFGKDAILDDMTLLGVGTASGNAAHRQHQPRPNRHRLHLYRLGAADHLHDAEFQRLQRSAGVFSPRRLGRCYTSHNSPQFQVGASFAWGDPKSDAADRQGLGRRRHSGSEG